MGSREKWKPISGYETLYKVSSWGRIFSIRRKIFLKGNPLKHGKGYLQVSLQKNGISTQFLVHRVVAQAFVANPDNKPEVNHKNLIPGDCRACNLEWATRLENMRHAYKHGVIPPIKGEQHGQAKLDEKAVKAIRVLYECGESLSSLGRRYGVTYQCISFIVRRQTWRHI